MVACGPVWPKTGRIRATTEGRKPMPLKKGKSRATVSANISEMVHAGYPRRQDVAASLSEARRSGGKKKKKKR